MKLLILLLKKYLKRINMSESVEHIRLIGVMLNNLPDFITGNMEAFIQCDLPDSKSKPPIIFSEHRPDVYLDCDNVLFIGEAKTKNDVFSRHSKEQYYNYLKYCDMYVGNSYLSVIVPWDFLRSLKNYLKNIRIKQNFNVNIIIYNDLGYKELI